MGEPTFVMHTFSYTAPEFSNETHEKENENPMYGIGDSVSFGRFMTEDLSWERWSSFNGNDNKKRYVEEAEKYSKPGSVAQKKAYFEAHFKRVAALKAAALLEQENGGQEMMSEGDVEFRGEVDGGKVGYETQEQVSNAATEGNNIEGRGEKQPPPPPIKVFPSVLGSGESRLYADLTSVLKDRKGEKDEEKVDGSFVVVSVGENEEQDANNVKEEMNSAAVKDEKCDASQESSSTVPLMDMPPLQETRSKEGSTTSIVKKNPPLSSYMPSIDGNGRAPLFASNSAASVYPTLMEQKSSIHDQSTKRTPLRRSINREFCKILAPVIRKVGSSPKPSNSKHGSTPTKDFLNVMPEPLPVNPDSATRGVLKSPGTGRNKISSRFIPIFCIRSREQTARRNQKLEEHINGAPEKDFKERAGTEYNKWHPIFCFKAMSSPDNCRVNETQINHIHKSVS